MPRPRSGVFHPRMTAAVAEIEDAAMPDTCVITSTTGTGRVQDPATGEWSDTAPTAVYTGECRFGPERPRGRRTNFGERVATVARDVLTIPLTAPALGIGMNVTVGSAPDQRYRVAEVVESSTATARRALVETIETIGGA